MKEPLGLGSRGRKVRKWHASRRSSRTRSWRSRSARQRVRAAVGELGPARAWASLVMWANFLRFVGDGITVAELPEATGIPKARTLSTLGGMERWGYVSRRPQPRDEARRLRERARAASRVGRWPDCGRSRSRGDLASACRRDRGALGGPLRSSRGRRASALSRGDRGANRPRAAGVRPDRRRRELEARRRSQWWEARSHAAARAVRAPLPRPFRLHARVQARVPRSPCRSLPTSCASSTRAVSACRRWRSEAASRRKPWRWRRPTFPRTATSP